MKAHTVASGTAADTVVPSYVLYSPQGSKPLAALDIVGGSATCSYDKTTRSQLLRISPSSHVSFLATTASRSRGGHGSAGIKSGGHGSALASQRVIILQLFCEEPTRVGFTLTIELLLQDRMGRRRIIFSNSFQKLQRCAQHVKVPLKCATPRVWSNIVFDVPRIHAALYGDSGGRVSPPELFQSRKLLQFTLTCSSVCRVRRLLGMPQTPPIDQDGVVEDVLAAEWPLSLRLPEEVPVNWRIIRTCEEDFLVEPQPEPQQLPSQGIGCASTGGTEELPYCPFEAFEQLASPAPIKNGSSGSPPLCPPRTQPSVAASVAQTSSPLAVLSAKDSVTRVAKQRHPGTSLRVDGHRFSGGGPSTHADDPRHFPFAEVNFDGDRRTREQLAHSNFSSVPRAGGNVHVVAEQGLVVGSQSLPLERRAQVQTGGLKATKVSQPLHLSSAIENVESTPQNLFSASEGQNSLNLMRERVRRIQELIGESIVYPDRSYGSNSALSRGETASVPRIDDDGLGNEVQNEVPHSYSSTEQMTSTVASLNHGVQQRLPCSQRSQSKRATSGSGIAADPVYPTDAREVRGGGKNCNNCASLTCDETDEDERFTVNIIRMSSSRDHPAIVVPAENTPELDAKPPMAPRSSVHNVDRLCFDSFDAGGSLSPLPEVGEQGPTLEWNDLGATPQAEKDTPMVSSSLLTTPVEERSGRNEGRVVIRAGRLGGHAAFAPTGVPQSTFATNDAIEGPLTQTPTQSLDHSVVTFHSSQRYNSALGTAMATVTPLHSQRCGCSVDEESSLSAVDYRRTPASGGTGFDPNRRFMVLDSGRGGLGDCENTARRNSCTNFIPRGREDLVSRCASLPPLSPTPSAHSRHQQQTPFPTSSGRSTMRRPVRNGVPNAVAAERATRETEVRDSGGPFASSGYVSAVHPTAVTSCGNGSKHRQGAPAEKVDEYLVFDPILKCYLDIRSNTYMTGPTQMPI
ncbi:uncharacterized protein TEOVI_000728100 [Trypanosoma equiperdum]|uniref:CFA20 domain-containing protein n=1 Tax=Trypanosoma equiperdum TaxID=5694 RepID=A0A1G4HZ74_TRYEQ|nr:hypothetical protein, conserved [Trypanosoma equiperdum]